MPESDLDPKPMDPREVRRIIRHEAHKNYSWRKRVHSHLSDYSDTYLFWAIMLVSLGWMIYLTIRIHSHLVEEDCGDYLSGWEDTFCLNVRDWTTMDGFLCWCASASGAFAATSIVMLILCTVFKMLFGPILNDVIAEEMENYIKYFSRLTAICGALFAVSMIAPYIP